MITEKKKFLMIDDHPHYRKGVIEFLTATGKYELIEQFSGKGRITSAVPPDFILLDLNLFDKDGIALCPQLKIDFPGTKIIALTQYANIEDKLKQHKFDGYVNKQTENELLDAIDAVLKGETHFLKADKPEVHEHAGNKDLFLLKDKLSKREIEVMKYVINAEVNYTSGSIAEVLHISEKTVKTHRKNFIRKTGMSNKVQIRQFMEKCGLLE